MDLGPPFAPPGYAEDRRTVRRGRIPELAPSCKRLGGRFARPREGRSVRSAEERRRFVQGVSSGEPFVRAFRRYERTTLRSIAPRAPKSSFRASTRGASS